MEDFANNFSTLMGTKVFDPDVKTIAVKVLIFIGVFAIAYVLQRVAAKITRKALKNMEDLPSATIIVGIVRALIWVIALLCILEPVFGINPTGLVAGLGVGSLVLSLGLKDSVANVFSGIILMATKTLVPGDYITIDGITGTVVDVTMRHTIVEDRDNEHVVIPNSLLDTSALTKIPVDVESMGAIPFTMAPGNDPDAVADDLVATVEKAGLQYLRSDLKTTVLYSTFTPFGLQGEIDFFAKPGIPLENVADVLSRAVAGKRYFSFVGPEVTAGQAAAARLTARQAVGATVPAPVPSVLQKPMMAPKGAPGASAGPEPAMGPVGASDATPVVPPVEPRM